MVGWVKRPWARADAAAVLTIVVKVLSSASSTAAETVDCDGSTEPVIPAGDSVVDVPLVPEV